MIRMSKIKHSCKCNDCKKEFLLEDAVWCKHKIKLGIGTKICPNCGICICHGSTVKEIQVRFNRNIRIGKFIKVKKTPNMNWDYQCKTIIEVEVKS